MSAVIKAAKAILVLERDTAAKGYSVVRADR
jgi:hypothetical protein